MDKLELIFNLYKDQVVKIKKFRYDIKRKYKLNDKEISNIYAKISKYQQEKYGELLLNGDYIDFKTKEELRKISMNRKTLKYHRLRNKGEKI